MLQNFRYPEGVWQRFCEPAHAGVLTDGDVHSVEIGSPASRALLRLQVRLQAGRIVAARFQAYGCPTTVAVGEWVAAQLQGCSVERLFVPSVQEIRQALEIGDDKVHCAVMGEDLVLLLKKQLKSVT